MILLRSMLWPYLSALAAFLQLASSALAVQGSDLYSKTPSAASILASSGCSPLPDPAQHISDSSLSNHTRRHPELHVLGYVTPWNPEGYDLVEAYRGRFSSVSPVWYNVRVSAPAQDAGEAPQYAVHGGPPTSDQVAWYKRLGKWDLDDKTGQELAPVKVLPRFMLEGWTGKDFQGIIGSSAHGISLTESIFAEVSVRGYDGIVLEAAAAWAMREPIKLLADRLHADGKEIVVVLQALREGEELQDSNKAVIRAVEELTPIVDYLHVMTYDFLGPPGAPFQPTAHGSNSAPSIPPESPLLRPGVRSPGPNTPFSFLEANLESLVGHLEIIDQGQDPAQQIFSPSSPFGSAGARGSATSGAKLLAGIPMYGYSYPLAHMDVQGTPHVALPPLLDLDDIPDTGDEEKNKAARDQARRQAEEEADKGTLGRGLFRVLSGPGEPVTIRDVRDLLSSEPATLIRVDESSDEMILDYFKAKEDSQADADGKGTVTAWYRRAYVPSFATMQARLSLVEDNGAGGVALWDVGQGGAWLLHAL